MKKLFFLPLIFFLGAKSPEPFPEGNFANAFESKVLQEWIDLLLTLTQETKGFVPPVAARTYGYMGLGFYEALRPGMSGRKTMSGQISGLSGFELPSPDPDTNCHWGLVANAVLAEMTKAFFKNALPRNLERINQLEYRLETEFSQHASELVCQKSVRFGRDVASVILDYARSDGQEFCHLNNYPKDYPIISPDEAVWERTPSMYKMGLLPDWGKVRSFVEANALADQPGTPPPYSADSNSVFCKQAREVFLIVNAVTPERDLIAEYWSDEPGLSPTPPGHALSIFKQVLEKENTPLGTAAAVFAKVGMGLHDAFVACWRTKYRFNVVRPITFIRRHFDPTFNALVETPPFPEYTSGHSVQMAAFSEILTSAYGENYHFTDRTHANRTDIDGSPRSYDSFSACAQEAAISRFYGGIHYRFSIEDGLAQGKLIGQNINALQFK